MPDKELSPARMAYDRDGHAKTRDPCFDAPCPTCPSEFARTKRFSRVPLPERLRAERIRIAGRHSRARIQNPGNFH